MDAGVSTATATIDSLLAAASARHPERPALVTANRELSYAELTAVVDRLADRMASALGRAGAARGLTGERIGVIAPNVPALVAGMFAASRLGAVAVPLNARLRERELSQILDDARPALVVSVATDHGYPLAGLLRRLLPKLPSVRSLLVLSPAADVEDEIPGGSAAEDPLEAEVAALLYTSGTTGAPKGALVTHAREVAGASTLGSVLELEPDDRVVFVVPISHAFGLTCFLATVAAGACAVLVESTFSLAPLVSVLREHRPTVLHGPPSLFVSLLKADPRSLEGLRTGFTAGAGPAPGMIEALEATGPNVLNLYGLTEAGAVACCRPEDAAQVRYGTAGHALAGFELRVEPSATVPSLGELEIRGPHVTRGYHRRPADPSGAFHDGWFRTGDAATLEHGVLRIVGRAKDAVHIAGFNVFPAEVEAALLAHPDVVQAAVVGVADERTGEALQAFVVARPDSGLSQAALLRFAREQVAGYKVPYGIAIVPELPLLSSGKPDRRALARSAVAAAAGGNR